MNSAAAAAAAAMNLAPPEERGVTGAVRVLGLNHNRAISLLDVSSVFSHSLLWDDETKERLEFGLPPVFKLCFGEQLLQHVIDPVAGHNDSIAAALIRDCNRQLTATKMEPETGRLCYYAAFALGPEAFAQPFNGHQCERLLKQRAPRLRLTWQKLGQLVHGLLDNGVHLTSDLILYTYVPETDPLAEETQRPKTLGEAAHRVSQCHEITRDGAYRGLFGTDRGWTQANQQFNPNRAMAEAIHCTAELLELKEWSACKHLLRTRADVLGMMAHDDLNELIELALADAPLPPVDKQSPLLQALHLYEDRGFMATTSLDIAILLYRWTERGRTTAASAEEEEEEEDKKGEEKEDLVLTLEQVPRFLCRLAYEPHFNHFDLTMLNRDQLQRLWATIYPVVRDDATSFVYFLQWMNYANREILWGIPTTNLVPRSLPYDRFHRVTPSRWPIPDAFDPMQMVQYVLLSWMLRQGNEVRRANGANGTITLDVMNLWLESHHVPARAFHDGVVFTPLGGGVAPVPDEFM